MEKRFAFKFVKRLLQYVDSAQEFIAHLGESVTSEAEETGAGMFCDPDLGCRLHRGHGHQWEDGQVAS